MKAKPSVLLLSLVALTGAALVAGAAIRRWAAPAPTAAQVLANTPVDAGAALSGSAPGFTLQDQFGRRVSLGQFRGKVVVLAFVDSECTTICPLTTESMVGAERLLGPRASRDVELLGVNANPLATAVADVAAYSKEHGLLHRWLFLTGSRQALGAVWKAYGIYVQVTAGQIDHTPALYVIGPRGQERWVAETAMEYRAVNTEALVLAQAVDAALPASLRVTLPPLRVPPPPDPRSIRLQRLARTGSRTTVALLDGRPQLTVFVASWVPNLAAEWASLSDWSATHPRWRVLVVDVVPVEPGVSAFARWRSAHPHLAGLPVALDATGQAADAFGAANLPWLVLTDARGRTVRTYANWPTSAGWRHLGAP